MTAQRRRAVALLTFTLVGTLALVAAFTRPVWAHGNAWPCSGPITVGGAPGESWGLDRAIRLWNDVDRGQPRITRDGPGGQIDVRVVDRPGAEWVGLWDPTGPCSTDVLLNAGKADGTYGENRDDLRRRTTLHEFGHVLGLWHVDGEAIMDTTWGWRFGGRITERDRDNLGHVYRDHQ